MSRLAISLMRSFTVIRAVGRKSAPLAASLARSSRRRWKAVVRDWTSSPTRVGGVHASWASMPASRPERPCVCKPDTSRWRKWVAISLVSLYSTRCRCNSSAISAALSASSVGSSLEIRGKRLWDLMKSRRAAIETKAAMFATGSSSASHCRR